VLSILSILLCAFVFNKLRSSKKSTVSESGATKELRKVETTSYPITSIKNSIEIDGRVTAYEKINLAAEVQGKLISTGKNYRQGSSFSKGDLLFKIDNKDDLFNLKAQRSMLYNSITQIMPDLKFDYPNAFPEWKSYLDNFDFDSTTKKLPEQQTQKEKYFIGGKNILNQYFTIKSLEEKLNNYSIYAPFTGVFLTMNNFPGSLVSPGSNLGQIMNTYNYELVSTVSPQNLTYLQTGQTVKLNDELGNSFNGKISRTSKQIDQTTQSIPVYITVSGKGLRDGMYLKGNVTGNEINNINIIPKSTLVNNNQVFVFVDSLIQLKNIDLIKIKNNEAYVTGLADSDLVVSSNTNNLYSGQKVEN